MAISSRDQGKDHFVTEPVARMSLLKGKLCRHRNDAETLID
jgi:hypothetical protein